MSAQLPAGGWHLRRIDRLSPGWRVGDRDRPSRTAACAGSTLDATGVCPEDSLAAEETPLAKTLAAQQQSLRSLPLIDRVRVPLDGGRNRSIYIAGKPDRCTQLKYLDGGFSPLDLHNTISSVIMPTGSIE